MSAHMVRGCVSRLKNTKKYSNVFFFQFPSNSFFQNKQVIQQWESQHYGLFLSL